MDKVKIGIPKALLFYKYGELWIHFFENLGFELIISPNTNLEILENGKKLTDDEACLSLKIYMGHVYYLIDKCDYLLVPRIACLKPHEKLCTNFTALYDLVRNTVNKRIVHYNVDIDGKEDEFYAFTTMGLNLGFRYREVVKAYHQAKKIETISFERRVSKQQVELAKSNKIKVLLAGHPYNLHDDFIGKTISKILKENDVEIIYSDLYLGKYLEKEANKISSKNYWTYNREILGAITHYQENVDGIVLVTTFPCGPDSLTNEMILRKIRKKPIIQLIVDEATGEAGLATRIESFIDILKERSRDHEKTSN